MKNKKAKKLAYCELKVYERWHAQVMDLLLTRFLGDDNYKAIGSKKRAEWKFMFWATPAEIDIIDSNFTAVISPDWDSMYESLLKEVEES